MDILILNGELAADHELDSLQALLTSKLSARGHRVQAMVLHELSITYCLGCFQCWIKTPGVCRNADAAPDVARAFIGSDLVVMLTPVTFGGYSSELKKALDRIIGLVSPFFQRTDGETHHQKRYEKYPSVVVIGALAEENAEAKAVFHQLARRNAINMHAGWFASRAFRRGDWPATTLMLEPLLAEIAVQA